MIYEGEIVTKEESQVTVRQEIRSDKDILNKKTENNSSSLLITTFIPPLKWVIWQKNEPEMVSFKIGIVRSHSHEQNACYIDGTASKRYT